MEVGYIITDGDPYGRGPMHVCQVWGWGHLTGKGAGGCAMGPEKAAEIQDANGRLLAAAPDLLAACKALVEWEDHDHMPGTALAAAVAAARAAIEKAERET